MEGFSFVSPWSEMTHKPKESAGVLHRRERPSTKYTSLLGRRPDPTHGFGYFILEGRADDN